MNTLYRFYNAEDELLYVGLTVNPGRRLEKHRGKPWWGDVAKVTMEQHRDHAALRAAERVAIQTEKPVHNVRMNGSARVEAPADPEPALRCGLKIGEVYALGIKGGDCPVGIVVEGDDEGVILVLYDWMVGMFCGDDLWVSADTIERWKRAERLDGHQKQSEGYAEAQTVFGMDPLGAFQTHWNRRAKLIAAVEKAEW